MMHWLENKFSRFCDNDNKDRFYSIRMKSITAVTVIESEKHTDHVDKSTSRKYEGF